MKHAGELIKGIDVCTEEQWILFAFPLQAEVLRHFIHGKVSAGIHPNLSYSITWERRKDNRKTIYRHEDFDHGS